MDFLDIRWDVIWNYRELYIRGIGITIALTICGYLIGMTFGVVLGLAQTSKNKLLYWPAKIYVDVFRGTPMLVQILIIHVALIPTIFGESQGWFLSGILALGLNSAAYNAEIFRAGIQSIDKGQMEAARSLGLTHSQAMRKVIMPQAIRRMVPPLGNEFITLLKDSSLISTISAAEILYVSKVIVGTTFIVWEPYLFAAFLYLVMTLGISKLISYLEKRYSVNNPRKKKKEGATV